MKKLLFLFFGLAVAMAANAQDLIIKSNGDELQVKVNKVSTNEIEYKKWSNLNGPVYSISKSEVFMIKYENGEKDVFTTSGKNENVSSNSSPNYTIEDAKPANDNSNLIEGYNQSSNSFTIPQKDSQARTWFGILGVTKSSILSTDEIQINLIQEQASSHFIYTSFAECNVLELDDIGTIKKGDSQEYDDDRFWGVYQIEIVNKTDKVILIDKALSLVTNYKGESKSFFVNNQSSYSNGSSSGLGVNAGALTNAMGIGGLVGTVAGGINFGGGNQSTGSTTYTNDRIISISPHGKIIFSKTDIEILKYGSLYTRDRFLVKSVGEHFFKYPMYDLRIGQHVKFNEENSPYKKSYCITYSNSLDFSSPRSIKFETYVREIVGATNKSVFGIGSNKKKTYQKFLNKFVSNPNSKALIVINTNRYIDD